MRTDSTKLTAMQRILNIAIDDCKEIKTLQQEFTSMFPYLKIEFFAGTGKKGDLNTKKLLKSAHTTLGECRHLHNTGVVYITADMTVTELEQLFFNTFGLSAQIFRKSGRVWLETTVTDKWSLEKQNHEGEQLSKQLLSDDWSN